MSTELDEAIRRAREHAHRALLEALATVQALLDVLLRAQSEREVDPQTGTSTLQQTLDAWRDVLRDSREAGLPKSVVDPLLEALDREVARWERRARSDPEARTVLRAFIGLREILWEFVARGEGDEAAGRDRPSNEASARTEGEAEPRPAAPRSPRTAGRPRVRRFDVES